MSPSATLRHRELARILLTHGCINDKRTRLTPEHPLSKSAFASSPLNVTCITLLVPFVKIEGTQSISGLTYERRDVLVMEGDHCFTDWGSTKGVSTTEPSILTIGGDLATEFKTELEGKQNDSTTG